MPQPVGVYVHVPFCTAKCHYCDFNSYAGLGRLFGSYVDAACREIGDLPQRLPPDLGPTALAGELVASTINFGGGTPSLLEPEALARVLAAIRDRFAVAPGTEISLEANPGTVAESRLAALRELGVNRLSFGVQSFDRELLAELGRIHSADQAVKARLAAGAAGFDSVNLDFIYGLPRQTLAVWAETLDRALELRPEHLSLYALTVEPGTLFFRRQEHGDLPLPDEDLVADMYELASERLDAAGYQQYEISNWALEPRFQCQHNLGYWRNRAYLGVGPGAHSWFGGVRYVDLPSPVQWAKTIAAGGSPVVSAERVPREVELGETLMLGLRLSEGVDFGEISCRFGIDARFRFAAVIRETQSLGLTEWHNGRLRLTRRARLLGNEVFGRFLEDAESEGLVRV
ncbi:MAG TPA: radical SAM family heme chaperone HemW [Chloroflexota bacterium]|jgi:oxygen-independent coproporphyrinogen-3 oxidase